MATIVEWDGGALPQYIAPTTPTVDGEYMVFDAASDSSFAVWPGLSLPRYSARAYVTLPSAWTTTSYSLIRSQTSGVITSRLNVGGSGAPGQIRALRNGGVQVAQSSNGLVTTGGHYRLEMQADWGAQTLRVGVFPLASDTPLWDSGVLAGMDVGAANFTQFNIGAATGAMFHESIRVGRILVTDGVGPWLGRHASDTLTPPGGPEVFGVWNGSDVEEAEILGLWNGSTIEPVEVTMVK